MLLFECTVYDSYSFFVALDIVPGRMYNCCSSLIF